MPFVRERIADSTTLAQLQELLNQSLEAYRSGDEVKGAHLLQDFRRKAFQERAD